MLSGSDAESGGEDSGGDWVEESYTSSAVLPLELERSMSCKAIPSFQPALATSRSKETENAESLGPGTVEPDNASDGLLLYRQLLNSNIKLYIECSRLQHEVTRSASAIERLSAEHNVKSFQLSALRDAIYARGSGGYGSSLSVAAPDPLSESHDCSVPGVRAMLEVPQPLAEHIATTDIVSAPMLPAVATEALVSGIRQGDCAVASSVLRRQLSVALLASRALSPKHHEKSTWNLKQSSARSSEHRTTESRTSIKRVMVTLVRLSGFLRCHAHACKFQAPVCL